ncbi:aryl-alcohol dehydrogenase-like predicted oxidoreductase [Catenuloplanes nepalensis]|uniref:Aryl-alcohol dehydrogenase-like predicted oxidoreductase n=1 Tax=Catenuloplanes nepalensis TaxID=587533 RepID=A0ABT9MQ77_9ACTN|nr:aldo/keto reductase [Catenuloplanes nepalensis]MDP9793584.1 aryl-alcohol dehydrogenase-like predicted oxidoreductase [Catenuloplanes nepalensis]
MSSSFAIGGELAVGRLGYGTMQLTGPGFFGYPRSQDDAITVLRRAVELGVTLIDTADAYGPFVTDELVRRALHPYRRDLVIATKVGVTRPRAGEWVPVGRPEYLRQQTELSLRTLGLDRIDLLQLHRVDPHVPIEDQVGTLADLRREGKVRHIGLSEVTVAQIEAARAVTPIASVQNLFNLTDRAYAGVVEHAEREGIAFIPWYPLAGTGLPDPDGAVAAIAARHGATVNQLALAWLLRRSPVMLPIPGTSSVAHLEENVAAASIELTDGEFAVLEKLA